MLNKIPKSWQKVRLSDIVEVYGGGTPSTKIPEYWDGNIPWLTPAEVVALNGIRFVEKTERYITKEGLKHSSAKLMPQNSILLTSRATIGEVIINKVPMATNQGFINIVPKKVDTMFFFYWLKLNKRLLNQLATGSTFREISKSVFKKIEILLPKSITDQKRIASILSAFDDKIELNNKINQTLEKIAAAIFKEWFINFRFPGWEKVRFVDSKLGKIPEGWKVKRLSEIVKPQYGYTASAVDEKIGPKFLRVKDINKSNWIDWKEVPYCKIQGKDFQKYKLNKRDIVIARMADPGKVAIIEEDIESVFASYLIRLHIINGTIEPYFLYYYLRSPLYQNFISGASTGTTRKSANAKVITSSWVFIPSEDILLKFESIVSKIRNRIVLNVRENRKLSAIRDLLLPKLMRGEIKV